MPIAESELSNGRIRLFDTHCHLDLPELAAQQLHHWQQAQRYGVAALLIPAVEPAAWANLLRLRLQQPDWHVALGIHPWWAAKSNISAIDDLAASMASNASLVCAIGEIGLDYALPEDTFDIQQQLFSTQLALAAKLAKPVIVHHRKSQPALLAELKRQHFFEGGILHAFSGSQQQGKAFIDMGFKLGIGGTITYERAEKTRKTVQKLPLTSFVLETDAPSMPLSGFQGEINTPARLALVFDAFCKLRPEPAQQIAAQLWQNSMDILRLKPA
jgi:TatD DNase family protein